MESGQAIGNIPFPRNDSFALSVSYEHNISFLFSHL